MRLRHAAEFGLPVAVEDDPVDVAALRVGFPSQGFRRVEPDVFCGALGIVWIEERLDGAGVRKGCRDTGGDLVASHVCQLLIHQQGGIRVALADEAGVEPLLGDALELAEQVHFRIFAGITPFRVKQALREMENQRGLTHVAEMLETHVCGLTDDTGVLGH